jgi:hypothetical protein
MNEVIPIVEQRESTTTYCGVERRADWHTPEDCSKLLNVQGAMDGVNKRLDDGSARMASIEKTIKTNNDSALVHRKKFESTLETNTDATAEILEIVTALKGFIKITAAIGKVVGWAAAIIAPLLAIWYTISQGPSK